MTREQAEQLIEDKRNLLKQNIKFENDIWTLVDLYQERILNTEEHRVIVVIQKPSKVTKDVFVSDSEEFEAWFS